jgi:hypothetical protein
VPRSDFLTIQCLAGLKLEGSVAFEAGLDLVSPSDLPDTPQRRRYFPDNTDWDNPTTILMEHPSAALCYRWTLDPAATPKDGQDVPADPAKQKAWAEAITLRHQRTEDILSRAYVALVLSSNASIQLSHRYYEALHPGYPSSAHMSHPTLLQRTWSRNPEPIDIAEARQLYKHCQLFEPWDELRRLVRRFARARAQNDPVDAHLDLGIVAESLLTHGEQEPQGEIRNRMATRAAWFLGNEPDDRRLISKQVRRLYDLRSAAAHDGKLPTKKAPWTNEDRVTAEKLCTALLRATLEQRRFTSDWEKIVFG